MITLKSILSFFLLVVTVCPVIVRGIGGGQTGDEQVHAHKLQRPCAVCQRDGRCVPKIQCPAHMRPGSYNPLCHLGRSNEIGVCCFTGHKHWSESDYIGRPNTPVSVDHIKSAYHASKKKLQDYLMRSEKLVALNHTTPSFLHNIILTNGDDRADELSRGGMQNLFALKALKARQAISDDELALGFTEHTDAPYCPPPPRCPPEPEVYRNRYGECNNLEFPYWGGADTGFQRLLPPDYSDGVWDFRASKAGGPLPGARYVSSTLVLDASHPSSTHNMMFMQFGQFITHDVSKATVFRSGNGSAISCCANNGADFLPDGLQHEACAPIASGPEDGFYGQFGMRCHNFVRVQLAPAADCSLGYATQMNGVSHFVDLSQLYSNVDETMNSLRAPGGLLKTFDDYGRQLAPLTKKKQCLITGEGAPCFESGDGKANQMITLTLMHTIWTREHNRVASALARLNPGWDEDRIFLEARRIVQAEFQHIVYSEWLPLLLGPKLMQVFGLNLSPIYGSSYDPRVNPSVTAEFSGAAFRFGHSTVQSHLVIPNLRTGDNYETIFIPEVMFQPSRLRLRYFIDRLIAGLSFQPMQSVDPFVTAGLTKYMFNGGTPFGVDLAAVNVQRGRDFGLRTYNDYRQLIGLEPLLDFNQYSPNTANRLASVYKTPEDIDLWIGGLLEDHMEGAVIGPTFAHIIADQFSKLQRGDRYFYDNGPDVNPGAFTLDQLVEIKKVTFARILCDNKDGFELFTQSPNAFIRSDIVGNEPVPCDSLFIPQLDLSRFREM